VHSLQELTGTSKGTTVDGAVGVMKGISKA